MKFLVVVTPPSIYHVPTENPVSDLIFLSRNQGGRTKGTTIDNKRLTEISIANVKNEITAIVYQNKTELHGNNLSVGFLQNKIDEVEIKRT